MDLINSITYAIYTRKYLFDLEALGVTAHEGGQRQSGKAPGGCISF